MDFTSYKNEFNTVLSELTERSINPVIEVITKTITAGNKIYTVGNGGSASLASHFANDLSKCYVNNRNARVISLAENISLITMLANDFSYDEIYEKQLESLLSSDDLLIAISCSGNSQNILRAAQLTKIKGKVIALTGGNGGQLAELADYSIHVSSEDYGVIETAHSFVAHFIARYFSKKINS